MSAPGKVGTLDAVETVSLGGGVGGRVSSVVVQFEFLDSADASITIQGRTQRVNDNDKDRTLLAVAYKDFQTGANSTSAITGNKSILVDAAGLELYADVTTITTGSVAFSALPLLG